MSRNISDIEIDKIDLEKRIRAHADFLGALVIPLQAYRSTCMKLQGYKGNPKAFTTDGTFGFENSIVEYIKKAQEYLNRQPGETIEATAKKIFYLDSLQKTFLEDMSARSAPNFWARAHKKALYHDIQEVVREEMLNHNDLNIQTRKWYQRR